MIGIYKITSPSGRLYVGQSVNIERRFKTYRKYLCEQQPKLHRSFIKHGVENHVFEIIEECVVEKLNERERYWQDFYWHNSMNLIKTKSGDRSGYASEETKAKLSKAFSGNKNPMYGKSLDIHPMLGKKGELSPLYGRKHSKETISRMSEKAKGRPVSEASKQKLSEINGTLVLDTETGIFYTSIKMAAKSKNIKDVTLKAMLAGKFRNNTSFIYG